MAKGYADLQYCSKMENRPIWRKRILGNFNFGQKKMSKIVLRRIESKIERARDHGDSLQ